MRFQLPPGLKPRLMVMAVGVVVGASAHAAALPGQALPQVSSSTTVLSDQALADGRVAVMVELRGDAAAQTFATERQRFVAANRFVMAGSMVEIEAAADRSASNAAYTTASSLRQAHAPIIAELTREYGAQVLFNARFAMNGVAVLVAPEAVSAIAGESWARRVSPLAAHELHAATSIDFTGARTFWRTVAPGLNLRGSNIGVGVIDTGIDHMHRAFSGPGGTNYAAAVTTVQPFPAPPATPISASFPTPKVVWGFDFVGDAYNASGPTDAQRIPQPDPNAMDTNGHGTAVASLIAGSGTNNDGSTYGGPWNETAPNITNDLRISPGYAPQASLYALRVFGTSGSSFLPAAALDASTAIYLWQSNPGLPWDGAVTGTVLDQTGAPVTVEYSLPRPPVSPRLRVINLSLGSNAGDIEESSAVAAQRAADAGLVVVMSAGNAFDTLYITGAPGVATGGISVAASLNDQFPGGLANAPENTATTPPQAALAGFSIINFGSASYTSAPFSFNATDAAYARPAFGGRVAPTPPGYVPPDPGILVTLVDPTGVDINLFSADMGGNLVVTLNPAANNIYAGKVVLVDRGAVGFHQKALAVQRAGGIAALVVNNTAGVLGMAANPNLPLVTIPSVMIEQAVGATFTLNGTSNTTAGERPNVQTRPGLQLSSTPLNLALQDTMAAYSSRGPRRNDDAIKPDVSAPAEFVSVARATTGDGVGSFNGTSSAAPHTAGAMVLLHQLRPSWSNYELKALLLNSVANDISSRLGATVFDPPTGPAWGVSRQGVGRWDLDRFEGGGTDVIAFSEDPQPTSGGVSRAGAVNASFGVVDVVAPMTVERSITVRNKGTSSRTFTVGITTTVDTPGVSYSLPDGNQFTVFAGTESAFRVRMTADPMQMRHAREPTLAPFQIGLFGTSQFNLPRQFMNEESAYVTLTPDGGLSPTHRVTVQGFPRRASTISVAATQVPAGPEVTLPFQGSGFNTGPNLAFTNAGNTVTPNPVDIASFAKGFELGYRSTQPVAGITEAQRAADLEMVGVTGDFGRRTNPFDTAATGNTSTVLVFGIAARGQYDTVQDGFGTEYWIEIDQNRDGAADRRIRQLALANANNTLVTSNLVLPAVAAAPAFNAFSTTGFFPNIFSSFYTNHYNNSVVTIPVRVSGGNGSLGLTAAAPTFNYRVRGFHRGLLISETPWISYDVSRPGVTFPGLDEPSALFTTDGSGTSTAVTVATNVANIQANGSLGLMMLYPMNAPGQRAQAIPVVDGLFADGFETPPPAR